MRFMESTRNTISLATSRVLVGGGGLLCAFLLGVVLIQVLSLPKAWAALVCLAIGGTCAAIIWTTLSLPLISMLRVAWLATFWFRLEINLFAIKKQGHETPAGVVVSLNLLLGLMLVAAHLYARWQRQERGHLFPGAFTIIAILLSVLCVLSVMQGAETQLGIYSLTALATEFLICYVAVAHFSTAAALRQVVICFAVAILLNAFLGILQYFDIFSGWELLGAATGEREMKLPGMEVSRATGFCESPNTFGWMIASFGPLIITPVLLAKDRLRQWERYLCVIAFFFGVIALILTFSRGSWVAFLITMPVLVGMVLSALPPRERWKLTARLAGALIVILLLSLPFLSPLLARAFGEDDGAAESRIPLMDVAIEMIKDNPLLGVGLSSYEAVMRRYDRTPDFISDSFPYPVHNVYLNVAAEAGLPALCCLLSLVGITLWCGWGVWRQKAAAPALPRAIAGGAIVGMLAYLISALKELSSFDSGQIRMLFLLFGLLIAAERAARHFALDSDDRREWA